MNEPSTPDSTEVAERRVGDVIAGKWRLERVLGVGGMAAVYAATHTNNLRPAAVKLLHPELAANADLRRRFLREGYFANKVGHAGAVAILDDGVDDADVFLVMELLSGESLATRRDRTTENMGPAEALRITDKMLDVLIAAHAEGIVHRDLKPDNVFLLDDGSVKVLDFGIARLLEPVSDGASAASSQRGMHQTNESTKTGVMMGTPQYMPPEQARGRVKEVDERSDLFSVGAIVFTLLTGRHVHEAETPNEALLRAMTTPAPSLGSIVPGVHPRVAAVVNRALAFERDDRWPNARAMQTAVREALAEIEDAPPSAMELAPTQLSLGKIAPAVTRAPTPVVNDVSHSRSNGGRVALVILALGAGAVGASYIVRSPPFAHVTTGGGAIATPLAPLAPTTAAGVKEPQDASVAEEGSAAEGDSGIAEDAAADGAAVVASEGADAETDEEDDDGGDEEDFVIDAGHGGMALVKQGGHGAHKGAGAPVQKGRHKRRKKR